MKKLLITVIISFVLFSCNREERPVLKPGIWRAYLSIDENDPSLVLPFNFNLINNDQDSLTLEIMNAEERILIDEISFKDDSLIFWFPVFNSAIKASLQNDSLSGNWHNYARGDDCTIPFTAVYGNPNRFIIEKPSAINISGEWAVEFSPGTVDSSLAIGVFEQSGDIVSGTFLTEIGDYGFIEGIVSDNILKLSCFDGAHAFLFTAELQSDTSMKGRFYSGKHWSTDWRAVKSDTVSLRDPYTLTFIKEGYEKIEFSFPDINGREISLNDEKFKDKVVLVHIMGTWCPNCMEATKYLAELYYENKNKGLEIVALAFERQNDLQQFKRNVERLRKYSNAEYEFLLAGSANKKEAAEALPMLNHILSYPTTVFIDKYGKIRKIHTGFLGKGTGERYFDYVKKTDNFVKHLLNE